MESTESDAPHQIPTPKWYVPYFLPKTLGFFFFGSCVIFCVLDALITVLCRDINETYMCLIPKVKHPQKITEFRPISLCNMFYKIISKVLASRLKRTLSKVINESQSAFVPGRLITNNVLVTFETMHCIN